MRFILRDMLVFLAVLLVYFCGRLALLVIFGAENISQVTPDWTLLSLRFDTMTGSYLLIPTLLLTYLALFVKKTGAINSFKKYYAVFIIAFSICLAITNIVFFSEYKSQFNQWILGIFYDDFVAIMSTIVKTYPIFLILFGIFAIIIFSYFLVTLAFKYTEKFSAPRRAWTKCLYVTLSLPVMAFGLRGASLGEKNLDMSDAIISDSAFLNNLIPTSAYCIRQELKTHFEFLSFDDSLEFYGTSAGQMQGSLNRLFGGEFSDIDEALTRAAEGSPLKKKPDHIFVIIVESHSAWPLLEKYKYKNLMPKTEEIMRKSLASKYAISAGISTADSVTSIIGGLPFAMLSASCMPDYPADFSMAALLKPLGYTSRFFTASATKWCHIGDFTKKVGFDECYGREIMGEEFAAHEWGVPDRPYYKFLSNFNFGEKSVNVILTVSNHPPYDVNLAREECPNKIDNPLENKVQHAWYADDCLGEFVSVMRKKYPSSLFIITGDHSARLKPAYLGDEFANRMCVPLIFAGLPIEDAGLANELPSASHMDIIPTLVELLADKGHVYKAWGENLLRPERSIEAMNPYSIFYGGKLCNPAVVSFPAGAKERKKDYFSLAYWRSMKGSELPKLESL